METMLFYIIAGAIFLFSMAVRQRLSSTYRRWGAVRSQTGRPGGEVARIILDANGLQTIPVQAVEGKLTDHYDPRHKQLRLSRANFVGNSVAATAVAAHECGHAIQDGVDYRPMEMRTSLVPIANVGARFGLPLAIIGSVVGATALVQVGVLGYIGAMLLTFLTLPVEFNASKRALSELDRLGLVSPDGREGAQAVLRAAAMTYVAGVASSAGYLVYLLVIFGGALFRRGGREPLPPRI
jgi:Zn-dependent membrane protease YugP